MKEIQKVVCYSLSLEMQETLAYLRFIAPFRQAGVQIIAGLQNGQAVPERAAEGDAVLIQRQFPQRFNEYQQVVAIARQEEKVIVYDLDDLLFFLPEDHPDRILHSFAPALLPMLQALLEADVVSVSTNKLRDVLIDFNSNTVVLPNYFDDTSWHLRPPIPSPGNPPQEQIVIGYMGTNSHKPDLEYIAPVLLHLMERYPQKIRLNFWGTPPPLEFHSLPQVQWTPYSLWSYPEFVEWFQIQSADIFVAPLVDNLFNRCKSPLKFFEYSALGVPGVFSRLDPYEALVRHGHNGFLAGTYEEWEDCLIHLIEDEDLRFHLATQAQATVKEKWLLSQNISQWLITFQNAIRCGGKKHQEHEAILNVVTSINVQLFEALQGLNAQITGQNQTIRELNAQIAGQNQTIQGLNAQIAGQNQTIQELNAQIMQLETEILGYVLSHSWQLTRPFRAISKRLKRG